MIEDLSAKITDQKRIALRNRNRLHWIILGSIIAGFTGAILWLWNDTSTRPGEVVGTAVTSAVLVGTLLAILLHRHVAKCPQCGFDWTIDERSETHMLTWTKCPGCGLEMIPKEKVQQANPGYPPARRGSV